jgi:hypothetical protein
MSLRGMSNAHQLVALPLYAPTVFAIGGKHPDDIVLPSCAALYCKFSRTAPRGCTSKLSESADSWSTDRRHLLRAAVAGHELQVPSDGSWCKRPFSAPSICKRMTASRRRLGTVLDIGSGTEVFSAYAIVETLFVSAKGGVRRT